MRAKNSVSKESGEAGFTLLEILVVVVILGILAAVVAPRLIGRTEDARITEGKIQMRNLETALKLYRLDNHNYPTTAQGLESLVRVPSTGNIPKNYREGGYMDQRSVPSDPWGNPFIYISPGTHGDYEIISLGADGIEGGDGHNADIKSWER